jgi:hypothetical protein
LAYFGRQKILIICSVNDLPKQRPALNNFGKAIAEYTAVYSPSRAESGDAGDRRWYPFSAPFTSHARSITVTSSN